MKIQVTLIFLCFSLFSFSQEYSVEKFPNRVRLSWETVSMSTEADLGFVGIGFDLFHLVKNANTIYVGVNSYSAVTGIRPGLITLGMSAGWSPQLTKSGLFLDVGGFLGGGGGGGADDGGGLSSEDMRKLTYPLTSKARMKPTVTEYTANARSSTVKTSKIGAPFARFAKK